MKARGPTFPLGQRPDSRWVPVNQPSRALAALVDAEGDHLGGTPWNLVELAKTSLPEEQRQPFLLMIGDVLGSVFTNLTRAVWNDYPEYAPQGWATNDDAPRAPPDNPMK